MIDTDTMYWCIECDRMMKDFRHKYYCQTDNTHKGYTSQEILTMGIALPNWAVHWENATRPNRKQKFV